MQELPPLRPHLLRLAVTFTGTVPDAEDLVQEAYLRALEKRDQMREGSNLRAWLRTVIRNLAIDESRRSGRNTVDVEGVALTAPPLEPEAPDPAPSGAQLRRAVASCPPDLRQCLELRYFRQFSYSQMARRLRIPVPTVGTRLLRARQCLRRILALAGSPGGSAPGGPSAAGTATQRTVHGRQ